MLITLIMQYKCEVENAVLLYRKVAALLEPQETYAELVNSFQVWLAICNVEIPKFTPGIYFQIYAVPYCATLHI